MQPRILKGKSTRNNRSVTRGFLRAFVTVVAVCAVNIIEREREREHEKENDQPFAGAAHGLLTAFVATSCGAGGIVSSSASPAEEAQTQKVTGVRAWKWSCPKRSRPLWTPGLPRRTTCSTWAQAICWSRRRPGGPYRSGASAVYPRIAELPDYSKATAEELLGLNPDMVIVTSTEKETKLAQRGRQCHQPDVQHVRGFQQSTAIMGQILGGEYEERAQKLVEYTSG